MQMNTNYLEERTVTEQLTPRSLLPIVDSPAHHTGRAALTCRFRCGNACAHEAPNESDNPYFGDILATSLSRRKLLRAGTVISATSLAALAIGQSPVAATTLKVAPAGKASGPGSARGLNFTSVAPNTLDAVVIPTGFNQGVVIGWGDRLFRNSPEFDIHKQTGAAQQRQFGYNNDFLGLLPLGRDTQVMMVNHEYTDEIIMLPDYDEENPTREQVEVAWAAHGLTVVTVKESSATGALKPIVGHVLNRRFHTGSEFELTGPAAGSSYVKTTADPQGTSVLGTLNNCSGGLTPWGTWLTGEENFNQYFANASQVSDTTQAARLKRYGISGEASERQWEKYDDRFDLAKEPNEANRFGFIVEIDPYDPTSTPKKRTALGRFKHEAAQPRITSDGRVAVYMGDDERFDYFYKFVSDDKVVAGKGRRTRKHNAELLDHGALYVARFTGNSPAAEIDGTGTLPEDGAFDGTGEWIKLVHGTKSFVPGMTAEEVLLFTRQAGDKVGATKMDRPEDIEPNPRTGTVYVALTNNTDRGVPGKAAGPDEANPRSRNKHGHVLEVVEKRNDSGSTSFTWRIFLLCGDPNDASTYFGGYDKDQVSPISCPDNLAFDPYGNLWIATDGNKLGSHDGLFAVAVEGEHRGQVKQFLTVPTGAETCGPWIDRDRVMVCVQHPGEIDGATVENPASQWPDGPGSVPRPSVVAVWPERKRRGRR